MIDSTYTYGPMVHQKSESTEATEIAELFSTELAQLTWIPISMLPLCMHVWRQNYHTKLTTWGLDLRYSRLVWANGSVLKKS